MVFRFHYSRQCLPFEVILTLLTCGRGQPKSVKIKTRYDLVFDVSKKISVNGVGVEVNVCIILQV